MPLIISLPEHRRGELDAQEVRVPVSLGDLFPTLCGLAGVDVPEGLDGIDLSAVLRGDAHPNLENRTGVIVEHLSSFAGGGTEYRMIRSERYKYVAFRDCEDLAFDLLNDPDEQHNLLLSAEGSVADELERLRTAVLDGFDFGRVEASLREERQAFMKQFPSRVKPRTANQILLGDGRLVDADLPLEYPEVVSENMAGDFDDWPGTDT